MSTKRNEHIKQLLGKNEALAGWIVIGVTVFSAIGWLIYFAFLGRTPTRIRGKVWAKPGIPVQSREPAYHNIVPVQDQNRMHMMIPMQPPGAPPNYIRTEYLMPGLINSSVNEGEPEGGRGPLPMEYDRPPSYNSSVFYPKIDRF